MIFVTKYLLVSLLERENNIELNSWLLGSDETSGLFKVTSSQSRDDSLHRAIA